MSQLYCKIFSSNVSGANQLAGADCVVAFTVADVVAADKAATKELFALPLRFVFFLSDTNPGSINSLDGYFELLTSFFFANKYLVKENCPVLLVARPVMERMDDQLERLAAAAKGQGWAGIHVLIVNREFNSLGNIVYEEVPSVGTMELSSKEASAIYLQCVKNSGNYIFFDGASFSWSAKLHDTFLHEWQKAGLNDKERFLLEDYYSVKQKNLALQDEIRVLKEKLSNAEIFVEVAKTKYKDDYNLLFEFYRREYEVLPLWYKRFGHVIKIIMGKRKISLTSKKGKP